MSVGPWDVLAFARKALTGHGLRTSLSLAGISIGVAAVVLLTALGEGARRYVTAEFADLGTNIIIVIPGRSETTGALPGIGGVPHDITLDDARALQKEILEIDDVAPIVLGPETVASGDRRRQVPVIGTTRSFRDLRGLVVAQGDFLPAGDMDRGSPVIVLGAKVARELFPGVSALGGVVRVGDWRMRVIGVLVPRGTHLGMDMDDLAVVPVSIGMRMFNRSSLFRVMLQVGSHAEIQAARDKIVALMKERHREEDITCITQEAVLDSLQNILGALTLALAGIAAISLAVAGVGIMNVMLVSVAERRAEVGLMKALGASDGQILQLFLAEAVLISGAGGACGIGASYAILWALRYLVPVLPLAPPVWAVMAAFLSSLVVGTIFGVLPARRASLLDPVLALRGGR